MKILMFGRFPWSWSRHRIFLEEFVEKRRRAFENHESTIFWTQLRKVDDALHAIEAVTLRCLITVWPWLGVVRPHDRRRYGNIDGIKRHEKFVRAPELCKWSNDSWLTVVKSTSVHETSKSAHHSRSTYHLASQTYFSCAAAKCKYIPPLQLCGRCSFSKLSYHFCQTQY